MGHFLVACVAAFMSFSSVPAAQRKGWASAGIWFLSPTVLQSSFQSCTNVCCCESQLNSACGSLDCFGWAKPASSCSSGKGSAQGRVESLFTVKDLTRQKNLKILLQKVTCLFHGCRDRFNRLKTTALDWKCNSGSKNAFCNPFVWEFFASACFG